ncbi:MAG: hypothetical protein AVDCRST_MAG38-2152, partial [uncultured Solirubrobacteraceae bacterium]
GARAGRHGRGRGGGRPRAGRQELRLRRQRAERLRLLRPDHSRVPGRRHLAAADELRPVRHGQPGRPRGDPGRRPRLLRLQRTRRLPRGDRHRTHVVRLGHVQWRHGDQPRLVVLVSALRRSPARRL